MHAASAVFKSGTIALSLLTCGSAHAAKPPTAPGTSAPEVVFSYRSNKGYQLRVANEDGSGAAVLHSSGSPIYARFGPRASNKIAFWEGKTLKLLTYEIASGGVRTAAIQQLASTAGTQFSVIVDFDYSPTGGHLAWWHPDERKIYTHDLQTGATSAILDTGYPVSDVTFTRDGQTIIYAESIGGSFTDYRLLSVPVGGGTPAELGISGNILTVDSGNSDDKLLLTKQIVNVGRYLEIVPEGQTSGTRITDGWDGNLHCSDERILFRLPGSRPSQLVYDLTTGQTMTFSRDSNVTWPSFMPTC